MSQVVLFKKSGTYLKDGEQKPYTNFYVRCGEALIPIQVSFFKNDEGRDPQYASRREIMKAFATTLPELSPKNAESESKPQAVVPLDDDSDIPL